jgi:hypothetical protein
MTLASEFREQGYVLLRGIFSAAETSSLRFDCQCVLAKDSEFDCDDGNFRIDPINREDRLRGIAFYPPLLQALRDVLGPKLAYIPEHSLLRAYYRDGFHRDSQQFNLSTGRDSIWADCLLARPAIYLQANHAVQGGGLDVIPGSHRGETCATPVTIFNQLGDVVLFHLNTLHQATPKLAPPSIDKIAIFLAVGPDDAHARQFAKYLTAHQTRYTDYMRPYNLRDETKILSERNGVRWLTGGEQCDA